MPVKVPSLPPCHPMYRLLVPAIFILERKIVFCSLSGTWLIASTCCRMLVVFGCAIFSLDLLQNDRIITSTALSFICRYVNLTRSHFLCRCLINSFLPQASKSSVVLNIVQADPVVLCRVY
jgi:hypothetical protein